MTHPVRLLGLLAAFLLLLVAAPAASAQGTHCQPGQSPRFVFGFGDLKVFIGAPMGEPLTCEFPDPNGTGDIHQRTSTGLAFWRKSTNTPTFTNGWEHWGRTAAGWVCWTGESIDPPANADPCDQPTAPPPAGLEARVTNVVDGDTADVQILTSAATNRLRIIGIDTPETVDPSQPVQCYGPEASARAKELLTGQTVTLVPDPTQDEVDRFGRMLVYVTLPDGRDFGEVMIREGFAREYTFRTAYQRQVTYRAAEAEAQGSGRGLWGICAAEPEPAPATGYIGPFDPAGSDRDCGDFTSWRDAQAFYEAARQITGQADRHRLDSDGDAIACETLSGVPGS